VCDGRDHKIQVLLTLVYTANCSKLVVVVLQRGTLRRDRDGIVASSFEDYSNNSCWICQNITHEKWDLWTSCRNMFCKECSTEMLRRQMPCPLCGRSLRQTANSGVRAGHREEKRLVYSHHAIIVDKGSSHCSNTSHIATAASEL